MAAWFNLHPLLICMICLSFLTLTHSVTDAEALLRYKKSLTNVSELDSWKPDSAPCTSDVRWAGIVCFNGNVTGLRLEGMGLSGKMDFDSLSEVKYLRTISLRNNSFSGNIPEFNVIGPLRAIYLSRNNFSGKIPSDFFAGMNSLKRVWLDKNNFSGEIPASLSELPNLQVLRLEENQFSGTLPNMTQESLMMLNVADNKLEGEIPAILQEKFDESAFSGNSDLCGKSVGKECEDSAMVSPPSPSPASSPSPSPSSSPSPHSRTSTNEGGIDVKSSESKTWRTTVGVAMFVTCMMVLLVLAILLLVRSRRKKGNKNWDRYGAHNAYDQESYPQQAQVEAVEMNVTEMNRREIETGESSSTSSRASMRNPRKSGSSHKGALSSISYSAKGFGGMPELVMLNEEKGVLRLSDLMKAAAEVLGNGGMGSSYKAVLASGVEVVVKRIREMNAVSREGFDAEMRKLALLKHPNVSTPLAYHYRNEEKLLVYEFIPNCSLLYLLHGDRGTSRDELNWPARLRIIKGIARGLGFIHYEYSSYDLPHGDLKSSNVLIGQDYEPLLSEFAFAPMMNSSHLPQALFAYRAPEALEHNQVSPKCDVFCLGVLILEILTGKFPSQYLNNGQGGTDVVQWVCSAMEETRELELLDPEISHERGSISEMEKLLHIGAACTVSDPEQRIDLMEAIRRIEEVNVEGTTIDRYVESTNSGGRRTTHVLTLRDGIAEIPARPSSESEISRLSSRSVRRRSE